MRGKIIITVVAGIVVAALIALGWWWFLGRAQNVPPAQTGTFGSAGNKTGGASASTTPTNIGSPVVSTGAGAGSTSDYVVAPAGNGMYSITTPDGSTLGAGTYTLTIDGVTTDYVVAPVGEGTTTLYTIGLAPYGANGSGTYNPNGGTATTTDLGLGSVGTDGVDWLNSGDGTVFNPTAVNQVNSSNPQGGVLPNFDTTLNGGSSGLGIGGALAGAALGAAVGCTGILGAAATALGLGTAVSAGGSAVAVGGGLAAGSSAVSAGANSVIGAAGGSAVVAPTSFISGDAAALTDAGADGLTTTAGAATPSATGGAASGLISVQTMSISEIIALVMQGLTLSTIAGTTGANTALHSADETTSFASCVARTIAKAAIQQITTSVVNWIDSGFTGSPSFVTNPTQFFTNVADVAAGQFIQGSALAFLCSPFQLQIKIAVANSYANRNANSCTLTGVINNINGFMNGNFSAGGWQGFLSFTTVPTNNPYGAYAYASIGLSTAISSSQQQYQNQLNQGRGFLSFQQQQNCQLQATPPASVNPNQFVQQVGAGSTVSSNGTVSSGGVVVTGGLGTPNKQSVTPVSNGSGQQGPTQSGATVDTEYEVCNLVTTTPGSVIAGEIDKTLGESQDSLNLAKSFDEIISALITQLSTKALQGGLLNLSGESGYSSDYYTPDEIAAQQAGQALLTQMQGDTSIAQQYGGIEQASIGDMETAQSQLNDLYNCWYNAAAADSGSAASQALENEQEASSTFASLQTQIDALNDTITNVNNSITTLEQFESRALSAASSDDTTSLTNDYTSAQAQGEILSQTDLTTAQQNRTTLQSQLAALNQQTALGLQQCDAL